MKMRLTLFALTIATGLYGQRVPEYRVTVGTNIRTPTNGGPVMFLPGISAGLSYFKPITERLDLKSTLNFSHQSYWNEATSFNKGPNPQDALGYAYSKASEYYTSLNSVMHYAVGNKFSVGAGLGVEVLLSSTSKFQKKKNALSELGRFKNREFKPVMPIVPVEFLWRGDKMMYNVHFEAGLMNRFRGDLAAYGPNFFGLIAFEVGMKI